MNLTKIISENLELSPEKVKNTVTLLKNQNTIPFIARYRKELTGNLDEVQIRDIARELTRLESLEDRKTSILQTIEKQGQLSDDLIKEIRQIKNLTDLEDIYRPYRPKRRARAMVAKEKGLEPLARLIINQVVSKKPIEELTQPYLSEGVPDHEAAMAGAEDIVAEYINENAAIRRIIRKIFLKTGKIRVHQHEGAEDIRRLYETYYNFHTSLSVLQPHQILAINRGEKEKTLKVNINIQEQDWLQAILAVYTPNPQSAFFESLHRAIRDAASRLVLPAIVREIRAGLTEKAEAHAINVFAKNLEALLTQPPVSGYTILAIDPGYRTGCKIAVLDPTGKLLDTATIYPHPPQNNLEISCQVLESLIHSHGVSLIVIGNGTASRETELFISEMIKRNPKLNYLITSEAGASVYSASDIARAEFPELDVSIRGAISIGRRVQDPHAELVKIDPKSIGIGLYQHDLNQAHLTQALDQVVESDVNSIGVEINTASSSLLMHIAGIGSGLAEKIIQFREENGPFTKRSDFLDVPGMGPKSFEQSAGFLRIRNGENFLDVTAIHPESYPLANKIIQELDLSTSTNVEKRLVAIEKFKQKSDLDQLATKLGTGLPTLLDILDELACPGRDPREKLPKPLLRKDVLDITEVTPGMILMGTIRNVVDFGAFVDIGVKTDGLLHRSKISKGAHHQIGDIITVKVLNVDQERKRISLSMEESIVE